MSAVGMIPARYASSRFPGKALAPICGRPMIEWVNETYRQDFEVFGYEPLDPSLFPATAPA